MRTKLRGKFTLLFMMLGMLLAVPAVALAADVVVPDGDLVTPLNQAGSATNPIDLGPVKGGVALTKQVSFELQCISNNNHVDNAQGVDIAFLPAGGGSGSTVPAGATATATNAHIGATSGGDPGVPTSWPDDGQQCSAGVTTPVQDNGNSMVTITPPSAEGTYNFEIKYQTSVSPAGNNDSQALQGNGIVSVFYRLTVDNTAPTVTAFTPTGNSEPITTNVTATFSEAMDAITTDGDPSTITDSTFTLTKPDGPDAGSDPDPVSGTVAYDSTSKKATLTPSANLDYSTTYTATVTTGAQDVAGNGLAANKTWTFTTAAPPCTNPADPVFQNTPNASGWFTNIPTPNATSATAGATVKYSLTENGTYNTTPPTLGEGETTVWAKAFSSTGTCSSAAVSYLFKVDTIAPDVTPGNVTNTTWRKTDLSQAFTASDGGSGLAPNQGLAADGGFTLTASAESADADTPTVVSKTVSDVAGNSTTRSVSALIDKTPPTITAALSPDANANGWNNSDVTVEFTCSDALSGLSGACPDDVVLGEGANQSVTKSVTDQAGNTASVTKSGINIDKTPPTISASLNPANPAASGWYNISTGAPKASYTCNDALSGLDGTCPGVFTFGEGNNLSHSETISDKAGNEATAAVNNIKVDLTKPSVSVTGVSNGGTYTTGNVPTPGCNTQDQPTLSGVKTNATVNVTGGTGGFGTLTATCSGAEDNAGNTNSASVTYSVSAAFNGFLQPIDGHTVNTGKYGKTYPIKWQLRDSNEALISDSAAQLLVGMMTGGQKQVDCTSFSLEPTDELESSTTGNTALRYDATSDQFIYNYKAPSSGSCYVFAIRYADGVTTQQIDFKFTK